MKWDYIFASVFVLYIKVMAIFFAYYFSKYYASQSTTSAKGSHKEKLMCYAVCISVVFVIGFLFTQKWIGSDDDGRYITSYNRGAIVFLALLIPILFGVTEGFSEAEAEAKSRSIPKDPDPVVGYAGYDKLNYWFAVAQNNYDRGDYEKAKIWFRKAAEQGHIKSQFYLGKCYERGMDCFQKTSEKVRWYREAAEQGDADAQYNLGLSFAYAEGNTQNTDEAIRWYRKAAAQGHTDAQRKLSFL